MNVSAAETIAMTRSTTADCSQLVLSRSRSAEKGENGTTGSTLRSNSIGAEVTTPSRSTFLMYSPASQGGLLKESTLSATGLGRGLTKVISSGSSLSVLTDESSGGEFEMVGAGAGNALGGMATVCCSPAVFKRSAICKKPRAVAHISGEVLRRLIAR